MLFMMKYTRQADFPKMQHNLILINETVLKKVGTFTIFSRVAHHVARITCPKFCSRNFEDKLKRVAFLHPVFLCLYIAI